MILNAEQIKKAVDSGEIIISPFDVKNLKNASYTFTLGNKVRKLKKVDFIDTRKEKHEFEEIDIDEAGYLLQPGEFVVLQSKESLKLTSTIGCFLSVRGKRAQEGLNPLSSAIFCEPDSEGGFNGPLSLETINNGPYPIKIFPGIRMVKGVFHKLSDLT